MNRKKQQSYIAAIIRDISIPILSAVFFILLHYSNGWLVITGGVIALILAVLSAVHHAEVIADRVGEPFGALVLALAITVIEASIIISLMLNGDESVSYLARDTVFAAVMIILTAMTGFTLLIGGIKYREQNFSTHGIISTLTVLVAISVLTLILPNFTQSVAGPFYSNTQLIFVAVTTLLLYGSFLFVQNFKHRNDFIATH